MTKFLLSETDNVKNFISKLDVFILTSYMEGIPNVLLEAQNQGLPIFSTRVGGIDECVMKIIHALLSLKIALNWLLRKF